MTNRARARRVPKGKPRGDVGTLIAARRGELALTQGDLARAIGASSNMAVSRWERGTQRPSLEMAVGLSRVLGVPVDALVAGHAPIVATAAGEGQ